MKSSNRQTPAARKKAKVRKQLAARNRQIQQRLDKTKYGDSCPVIGASSIEYEIADRTRAVAAGGIGLNHQMVTRLGLDDAINQHLNIFKIYLPYAESDHVLNIAYNLLAGGTCLEHLELRRNDEVYLDAIGAQRIPDPTTAGDFCRRFNPHSILLLMEVINGTRLEVWKQQPDDFFDGAVIDADGTMVETGAECKKGIDINYENKWGYHPLLISLANTGEPLYIVNRSGNRPSHEQAGEYRDRAVTLCRRGGFRRIRLRGDTDFTQTARLDAWHEDNVLFVFGIDAMPNLYKLVEQLPPEAWQPLHRHPRYEVKTERRRRPENVKEQIVKARNFKNIKLVNEHVAEFSYQPVKCRRPYRLVVVWKDLEVHQGEDKLFDDTKCFFYITNDWEAPVGQVVYDANNRCDQENLIEQNKNGVHALTAPVDNLESNWAYMVMASLAWSLKAWAALLLPVDGRWKDKHQREQRLLLRMDFSTFCNAFMNIPAQIVRTSRRIIYRMLPWNPWQAAFFRLAFQLRQPLRC